MEELSPRELEVLLALAARSTNQEIARQLFISVRTVESHVSALLRKLDAADRRQLATLAAAYLQQMQAGELSGQTTVALPRTETVPALVGRDGEVDEVRRLLGEHRLLTLVGLGGAGKTSLALAAAPPGTPFADLTRLPAAASVDAVGRALLDALGLADVPSRTPLDEVIAHLRREPRPLIVVDNCEHVVDAAAEVVVDLLARSSIGVLATSRERLAIRGERVHPVGGLPIDAANTLFIRRARESVGADAMDETLVVRLCEAVDRLPLAIELAAARLTVFPLAELVERVGRSVELLDGGDRTRPRHRSVRDMLAWSHDLLEEADRAVHRRLAVLPGPFTLSTAEQIAAGTQSGSVGASIGRLVDASLLSRDGDRYRQLELVRADAGERLDASGERDATEDRLLSWAMAAVAAGLTDGDEPAIRAAAEIAVHRDRASMALLDALADSWVRLGHVNELGRWFEVAATLSGDPHRAYAAGDLAISSWRGDDARRRYRLAAQLAEASGDVGTRARSLAAAAEIETRFWATTSNVDSADTRATLAQARALATGHPAAECLVLAVEPFLDQPLDAGVVDGNEGTVETLEQALSVATGLDDVVLMSTLLDAIATTIHHRIDPVGYEAAHGRRVPLLDRLARHHRSSAEIEDILINWAIAAIEIGRPDLAVERSLRSLAHQSQQRLPHASLQALVEAEYLLGDWDAALTHAHQAVQIWTDDGCPPAGWLVTAAGAARAISIARRDRDAEAVWLAVLDAVRVGIGLSTPMYTADAQAADALELVGRHAEAVALVADPVQGNRWTYLSVRAGVLGGSAVEEARAVVRGSAVATARWQRAAGDLVAAEAAFRTMGSRWEAARTRLAANPGDVPARQVLLDLGVALPM